MSCAAWQEKLALFAGGDLTREEAADVESHLAECAACRAAEQELAEVRLLLFSLRTVSEDELAVMRAGVMRRVASARSRSPLVLLPYAALVALLSFGWLATRQPIDPPRAEQIAASPPRHATPLPSRVPLPSRARKQAVPPKQETVVKLFTDDPDVVIVWISD